MDPELLVFIDGAETVCAAFTRTRSQDASAPATLWSAVAAARAIAGAFVRSDANLHAASISYLSEVAEMISAKPITRPSRLKV